MANNGKIEIINFLKSSKKRYSSKQIHESISSTISYATVKRIITYLESEKIITKTGEGKSTKYSISTALEIVLPMDIEKYYEKEIDEREIIKDFNPPSPPLAETADEKIWFILKLISNTLKNINIFTKEELIKLSALQIELWQILRQKVPLI